MQEMPQKSSVSDPISREELFEKVAGAFSAGGTSVDGSVMSLIQPLFDSTISYSEHRALLEVMLKELGG